ncbi:MAG: PKD-like family lipoprotein [Candidatus Pseudobacter hemicellulosilyticus]|uniref:PKD-like family lipoprotein n=1 Tax=Candidatus Pseudobacter hemicellulosilyticus TaxID=3121375 RepID=A0AAJ5WWR4_9BACT|nr:MAG: PKD-like family lipoprotein [Pseudobacter sp.]
MKRKFIQLLIAGLAFGSLQSCIKDKGDYEYNYGNEVTIRYATYSYTVFLADTLTVTPLRTFANPQGDTTDYDHAWYINGEQYSDAPVLKYAGKAIGSTSVYYYMIDRKSGIWFPAASSFTINTSSPFAAGWGILYEKDNESELAHVRINGTSFVDYKDLYKTYNNGESMGSAPVKIRDYAVSSGRGMYVLQRGGPGPLELDANGFSKKLVAKDAFTAGAPAGFEPVDMAFFGTADLLVNKDGTLYSRTFPSGALPFATPWFSTPVQYTRGLKISDIWDSWSRNATFSIMHDELNNRLLTMSFNIGTNPSGGIPIRDIPAPVTPYPEEYSPLNNLGNWDYVWGGTFNDASGLMDGAMLLRSPADSKLYWQTFQIQVTGNNDARVTPKTRVLFQGNNLVTDKSILKTVKTRGYLFFTAGADNKQLYYYDNISGQPVVKYTEFSSPITAIEPAEDGMTMAIGLEDGTFLIYDISNEVIISGVPKELHRYGGLGKVVDIIVKGGKTS